MLHSASEINECFNLRFEDSEATRVVNFNIERIIRGWLG